MLGLRFRLCPEVTRLTSLTSVAKAARLHRKQEAFCKHVVRITTWEISQLDYHENVLGCSLRQILMALRSTEPGSEHVRLFIAVEQRYWMQDGGFVLLTLPDLEHEARMTVAGLLPYLKHLATQKQQQPDRIESFFTAEAVDRMVGAYYDPTSREVISEDDNYLEEIAQCDEDMQFDLTQLLSDTAQASTSTAPEIAPQPGPSTTRPSPLALAAGTLLGGSASVTTFHTKTTSKSSHPTGSKKSKTTTTLSADTGSLSNQSIFTDADRQDIKSLQEATARTQSDIASIQSDLRSLLTSLALSSAPQDRPPGDPAASDAGPTSGRTGAGL